MFGAQIMNEFQYIELANGNKIYFKEPDMSCVSPAVAEQLYNAVSTKPGTEAALAKVQQKIDDNNALLRMLVEHGIEI